MSQYITGTVSVTNGSAVVTGVGTEFLTYVSVGDAFKIENIDALYIVGSVDTDLQFTLTANWAGSTLSDQNYQVVRDFTTNCNFTEIWKGDRDWPFHVTIVFRSIDTEIRLQKVTPSLHTDNYTLTTSDLGKSFRMNSALDKTFTLPSVGSAQDGMRVTFVKLGAGQLTIQAADTDYMHNGSAGGTIYNASGQTYATITLEYCHADTRWYMIAYAGGWTAT